MFKWVPKLVHGYKQEYFNIDDGKTHTEVVRRLTVVSNEKSKTLTQSMGFDDEEYESMNAFFSQEIKKNDAKSVLNTFEKFFRPINDDKLKKYFMDAVSKYVTSYIRLCRKPWISSTSVALCSSYVRSSMMKGSSPSSSKFLQASLTP